MAIQTSFERPRGSLVSVKPRNEMKQVRMTSAKTTIDANNWSCLKRVGGKRSALLKLPYIIKMPDTDGDDGRAGRRGEAHQRRGPTFKANDFVATLPASVYRADCCREPVRCRRVYL